MNLQARAETILASRRFSGVPIDNFEGAGREQLIYLLRAGLNPDSKVVDVGCGVLRAGYWLIQFLDTGCYSGIEPNLERLEIGKEEILPSETLRLKRPRFDTNANFDTSVFGEKFDFFLAYSIWTHASKRQIRTMLDSFLRDSTPAAKFLATLLPSNWRHRDYQGDAWFGTSHESDVPGCIHHSFRWVKAECLRRELAVLKVGRDRMQGQLWIEIARQATAATRPSRGKRALQLLVRLLRPFV